MHSVCVQGREAWHNHVNVPRLDVHSQSLIQLQPVVDVSAHPSYDPGIPSKAPSLSGCLYQASSEERNLLGDGFATERALFEGAGAFLTDAVSTQEDHITFVLHTDRAEHLLLHLVVALLEPLQFLFLA